MSIGNVFNTFFFKILLILVQLCVVLFTIFMGIVGCVLEGVIIHIMILFFFLS